MIELGLTGVGLLAPGLRGWPHARSVLAGEAPYRYEPAADPAVEALPQNERRRVARSVRWAMAVALEAAGAGGASGAGLASVFASSSGDGETLHQICEALAKDGREISPTRFHNSVHNAASGYWSIAARAQRTSVTLCAHDSSVAAALLEAAALLQSGHESVLCVAYDLPYPEPLRSVRRIEEPVAAALLLCAGPGSGAPAMARWRFSLAREPAAMPRVAALPPGLASNPAAAALPLLAAAARCATEEIRLPYLDGSMVVGCRP